MQTTLKNKVFRRPPAAGRLVRAHTAAAVLGAALLAAPGIAQPQTAGAAEPPKPLSKPLAKTLAVPTLKQIMADPSWFARSPDPVGWLPGSDAYLWDQRRPGVVGRDTSDRHLQPLDGTESKKLLDTQRPLHLPATDARADDGSMLLTHAGDLFLFRGGTITQLTRTADRESSPMFLTDGRIAFRRGGWVVRDLSTGLEADAADIRFAEDPAEKKEKEPEDLEQQQLDLFGVLRENKERDELNDRVRRSRAEADPTRVPGPFYLDKAKRSAGSWLSPSGEHLLVAVSPKDTPSSKNDQMPDYLTDDGYVTTRSVRPKVGTEHETPVGFVLLDLGKEDATELPLDGLPTISDDPLAEIKAAARERAAKESDGPEDATDQEQPVEDAKDGQADEADKDDAKPGKPRPVSQLGVRWSDSGRHAAVMVRSHDNKDRWILTVDTGAAKPAFRVAHHLHDPAWINWDFNEFGFVPGSETLWFLSEHTGYGHLYTIAPDQTEPRALTEGEFEVRSVHALHAKGGFLARTNRTDPGVYELERITGEGGSTALTQLGGTVESYDASPDETKAVIRFSTATEPPELMLVSLAGEHEPRVLTDTVTDAYRSFGFTTPDLVDVPSRHTDRMIRTRVYKPDPERFPGRRPIVVFSHGAGYLQWAHNGWSNYFREHMFHTLLNERGIVVVAPDFRASEGYGRDWRTAIYRNMGYPELEDFRDCIAWADDMGIGNPDNVGIYGGSYGGFMTLMAMFLEPDLYDAGAALRSVTDWRHYNHGYTSNILDTPQVDPEPFDRCSPITHAEGLKGQLLMCHGLLDDNVVAQDVIRLSQRLIELEKPGWELTLYPVEPHGFREPSSWHDEYRRILELFERVLLEE